MVVPVCVSIDLCEVNEVNLFFNSFGSPNIIKIYMCVVCLLWNTLYLYVLNHNIYWREEQNEKVHKIFLIFQNNYECISGCVIFYLFFILHNHSPGLALQQPNLVNIFNINGVFSRATGLFHMFLDISFIGFKREAHHAYKYTTK